MLVNKQIHEVTAPVISLDPLWRHVRGCAHKSLTHLMELRRSAKHCARWCWIFLQHAGAAFRAPAPPWVALEYRWCFAVVNNGFWDDSALEKYKRNQTDHALHCLHCLGPAPWGDRPSFWRYQSPWPWLLSPAEKPWCQFPFARDSLCPPFSLYIVRERLRKNFVIVCLLFSLTVFSHHRPSRNFSMEKLRGLLASERFTQIAGLDSSSWIHQDVA